MLFGKRGRRSPSARQRKNEAFAPSAEALEEKVLMAQLELGVGTPRNIAGNVTTPPAGPQTIGGQLPFIADSFGSNPQTQGTQTTDPGLGIQEAGATQAQGAGYSVAALGDMNGDGSADYIIGAPGVTRTGAVITPSPGPPSQAFLVFQNRSVTPPVTQSWLTSTPEQRSGSLSTLDLGNASQTNPFTARGQPFNYNFDGITFFTSQSPNSELGAFVAAAGPNAFVIGAPNYTGGGRMYYISASTGFNSITPKSVDLDNPTNFTSLTILTIEDTTHPTAGLGSSFAFIPDLFGDGADQIAIGEPGASLNGKVGNGGVFVFSTQSLPLSLGQNNVLQVQGGTGFMFAGANAGDEAGFSVANAGDVNGQTLPSPSTTPINDILIGAPGFNKNAGAAYLVYGGTTLTRGVISSFPGGIDLSRLSIAPNVNTDPTPPQGAVFTGAGNEQAGSTVSGAGDFNADGFSDFLIGAGSQPGAGGSAGRVNLIYGQKTSTTINPTTGLLTQGISSNSATPIPLSNPGTSANGSAINNLIINGGSAGDRAGFSLSYGNDPLASAFSTQSEILIGAPGWQAGKGSVYQLVGTANKFASGTLTLSATSARQYIFSFPTTFQSSDAIGFGSSVSSFFGASTGDFIAGGPGYTGTLPANGGATTPPFPLVGVGAMVLMPLQPANTLPVIGGTSGGGGGGGGGGGTIGTGAVAGAILPGLFTPTTFIPPFGSSFVPTVTNLSALNYAPIPLSVALKQYQVPQGFFQRQYAFNHPGAKLPGQLVGRNQNASRHENSASGRWTLGRGVFTRGRFHPGKSLQWTHSQVINGTRVKRFVPVQSHIQRYTDVGSTLV